MRQYRASLMEYGQVSPLFTTELALPHLVGESFADIGCGAGVPVSVVRARWPETPPFRREGVKRPFFVGVDFSPRAVAYANEFGAYDRVVLAESSRLPLKDREVDTCISLENLEHLFADEVAGALTEFVRIARKRIIFTTPWPWDVINVPWLTAELAAASADPLPMNETEFRVLAGALHKSTLSPDQLRRAGFDCVGLQRRAIHPVYVASPAAVDVSKLGPIKGIHSDALVALLEAGNRTGDFRESYTQLVRRVLDLRASMPRRPLSWPVVQTAVHAMRALRYVRESLGQWQPRYATRSSSHATADRELG